MSTPSTEDPALQHLDVLWYYSCVVSPHSHAAPPEIPRSCAAILHALSSSSAAGNLVPPPPSSTPLNARSPAAFSTPPSSSCSLSTSLALPDHQRHALLRVFRTFDHNGDGSVSTQEISRIFEKLGISHTVYCIESLLATRVTKSHGHVDQQEFLSLYQSIACSSADASADVDQVHLQAAFHVFDKDGNGFISPAELQCVLCSLGFSQARQLDACVDMIARVDQNGDGQVDFFEFKKLFLFENLSIV